MIDQGNSPSSTRNIYDTSLFSDSNSGFFEGLSDNPDAIRRLNQHTWTSYRPPAAVEPAINNLSWIYERSKTFLDKEGRPLGHLEFNKKWLAPEWKKLKESTPGWDVEKHYWETRIKSEYNALCTMFCGQTPTGNWIFLISDLMGDIHTERLLSQIVPRFVENHPATSAFDVDASNISTVHQRVHSAYQNVQAKILNPPTAAIRPLLTKIGEGLTIIVTALDLIKYWQEFRDWAQRRLAERQWERMEPIRGAENHVDSFDRNREWISRTC